MTGPEFRGPVVLVHLEDPSGSGRASCSGHLLGVAVSASDWPQVPRVVCTGCLRGLQNVTGAVKLSGDD